MEATEVLALIRPVVLIVDPAGIITAVHGGFGGFLGLKLEERIGSSVFDFVAPRDIDELATYFLESAGLPGSQVSLTLPFRIRVVGGDGFEHQVEIIPTGLTDGDTPVGWIVVVLPLNLTTSTTRSLDAEMAGADRHQVRALLTEELLVENADYSSRYFYVDLGEPSAPTVISSHPEDQPMVQILQRVVPTWRPWESLAAGQAAARPVEGLHPDIVAAADPRGWRRVVVTPVMVDGIVAAAFIQFGRVPLELDLWHVTANVNRRIQRLVDITALLISRWRDTDRLADAAASDPLTGLANRQTFAAALAAATLPAHVLYIDLDHFKRVNDRLGHLAGDRVLVEIGRRIDRASGPDGLAARLGGDEFVVLLAATDRARAADIAEAIKDQVSAPISAIEDQAPITVSVGMAAIGEGVDAVDEADRAMLRAKVGGRARALIDTAPAPPAG